MTEPDHYNVNPLLVESHSGLTKVHIRAVHPDEGAGTYDIACLKTEDLDRWLNDNPDMAKRTVKSLINRLDEHQASLDQASSMLEDLKEKVVKLMAELNLVENS